jgi:hypothetical protein
LPISAADSITLAVEHTKQQLFRPFRIGQWTKLAFVGLLAGELGFNGTSRSSFSPHHPGGWPHPGWPGPLGIDHALLFAFIAAAVVAAIAIGVILLYIGSVMRFVLFDSILARECHIRQSWSRRMTPGWRYFVWKLAYCVLSILGIAVVIGIPAALAYNAGWFQDPKAHVPVLVPVGLALFFLLFAFGIATAVILVLTKDFVVPQMALEDIDTMEGWRRLWPMIKAEPGAYAGYVGMKIALAIVAGILIGIGTLLIGLFFVVPTAGLSLLAIITGKTAGMTWNPHTIALAVLIGCIVFGAFFYLVALISVPALVFFPAYSLYFFAGRYPRLVVPLYPASAMGHVPAGAVPRVSL